MQEIKKVTMFSLIFLILITLVSAQHPTCNECDEYYYDWGFNSIDECYSYYSLDCYPPLPPDFGEIPEFSTIGAALAIVGAGAYILRKKKT